MERLTCLKTPARWDSGRHPTKYTSRSTFPEVVERLAYYEDAEQDGRLVVLPVGVDRLTLLKELRDLEQVEYGDAVENYTAGYRNGHKNGSIETLRRVLGVTDETTQDAAMKGGAE